MKFNHLIIIFLFATFGLFAQTSQKKVESQVNSTNNHEKHASFKQKLMDEYHANSLFSDQNKLGLKSSSGSSDYGSPPALNYGMITGGSGTDVIYDIKITDDGSKFITGKFSGEIEYKETQYKSQGHFDAFIAKLDNSDNISWFYQLKASEYQNIEAYCLVLDKDDNIIVTGRYTGNPTVGGVELSNFDNNNLFAAKITAAGELVWINGIDTNLGLLGKKIDTDKNGNVYIIASKDLTESRIDASLLKLNGAGEVQWQKDFKVGLNDLIVQDDSIYIAGVNSGEGILNNGIVLGNPDNSSDVFISKTNLEGEFAWAKMFHHLEETGYSRQPIITLDENNNVYLFSTYDSEIGYDTLFISEPGHSFIAKFDSVGHILKLIKTALFYRPKEILMDNQNNLCVLTSYEIGRFTNDLTNTEFSSFDYFSHSMDIYNGEKFAVGTKNGYLYMSEVSPSNNNTNWELDFGGNTGRALLVSMAKDNDNNIYSLYNLSNTIKYNGTKYEKGILISKQTSDGVIKWTTHIPEIQLSQSVLISENITINNKTSMVYITGDLNASIVTPNGTLTADNEINKQFILQIGFDGNIVNGNDYIGEIESPSVKTDKEGNVYFTGSYRNNLFLEEDNEPEYNYGAVLVKFNNNLELEWYKIMGGNSTNYSINISTDSLNNIYLTGESLADYFYFNSDSLDMRDGKGNVYYIKLSPEGSTVFAKVFGGTNGSNSYYSSEYATWPTGLITDKNGICYMKGWHGDSVYFDNELLLSKHGEGYSNFIAKIDEQGNIQWVKTINNSIYSFGYSQFDLDEKGAVYFAQSYVDTVFFGDDNFFVPVGREDLLLTKYDANGNLIWINTFEGDENTNVKESAVIAESEDVVYLSGRLYSKLEVDNNIYNTPSESGFLFKFGTSVGINNVSNNAFDFNVYPNPVQNKLYLNGVKNKRVKIYNEAGQLVYMKYFAHQNNTSLSIKDFQPGIYFVSTIKNGKQVGKKIIKY